jgi:RNase P subunit RPR2
MSHYITVTCHKCGHQWSIDLDREQAQRVFFRGKTRMEQYQFTCLKCGVKVITEVEREE